MTASAAGSTANGGTAIASYTFNWGDGTSTGPQAGSSATHTYNTAGTYTVTLTVRDSTGQTANAAKTVTVEDP